MPKLPSRDERLAAKLRENLRRRKTQARAQAGVEPIDGSETDEQAAQNESATLSNPAPES